jgi:hypothetical protein
MNTYNNEYFFVRKPKDEKFPYLVPDKDTEDRNFEFEEQTKSSPPLVFTNGWEEECKKKRIKTITPDILFAGPDLLVRTPIYEKLLGVPIKSMHMHPAIYIDDNSKWHEDYWYLTFTRQFDCWDRDESEYDRDILPVSLGGEDLFQIFTYSLNPALMNNTKLQERLIFKMGGTLMGMITCHKSLISIFRGDGKSGADIIGISDYGS